MHPKKDSCFDIIRTYYFQNVGMDFEKVLDPKLLPHMISKMESCWKDKSPKGYNS